MKVGRTTRDRSIPGLTWYSESHVSIHLLYSPCFLSTSVPDPEMFGSPVYGSIIICTDPDPFQYAKKVQKNLDFYCLVIFYDFISLKTDGNVIQSVISKKIRKIA
jgi:hypothetical protein